MREFEIGGIPVGENHPPILLADIGTFFNQDIELARSMIDGIKSAGCEFIKGEILNRADVALDDETLETYYSEKTGTVTERYRALIERKVISFERYEELFAICHSYGQHVVLSVYDIEAADFAKSVGACALKVASSNVVHEPLIRHVAGLGIPMIIDTGKSTLEEIARAMQWARDAGGEKIVIEHSPDAPPAPVSQHHLRMLASLRAVFDCPVGLSDHHVGNEIMLAASALGASLLEKGVCADDAPFDQDVNHAMRMSEVGPLLRSSKLIHQALGSPMRSLKRDRPKPAARMGLVARANLPAGTIISLETVDFAWPARGIPVEDWSQVTGWRLRKALPERTPIKWSDVEAVAS